MDKSLEIVRPVLKPADILAGLGGADRKLLATCIALFEDSTLTRRIEKRFRELQDSKYYRYIKDSMATDDEDARAVRDTMEEWFSSELNEDELRLVLWIHLRESLSLPPRLSGTYRGCAQMGDDLSATLINYLDPPGAIKSGKRWLHQKGWLKKGQPATRLSDIVLPVLDGLLETSEMDESSALNQEIRRERLAKALFSLSAISEKDRESLLNDTGVNNTNDQTIKAALAIGGALSLFGAGVGTAGFSAYILAAQISAFVPLVTGPGLVSFVSVISNPISIITLTGGGAWWLARSARHSTNVSIASHVVALLVVQGLQAGPSGIEASCRSFRSLPKILNRPFLKKLINGDNREKWLEESVLLRPIWETEARKPTQEVMNLMNSKIAAVTSSSSGEKVDDSKKRQEWENAGALGMLTVGDILYNAAAIDPQVLQAADFSRVEEVGGYIEFSQIASEILSGSGSAILGGINQLKGYVAERVVAAELVSLGHTVSFPEESNQPGFDIIVDGQPFQVKFNETLQGIREHFDKYEYPVFANADLVGKLPDEMSEHVYFIQGLNNEFVTDLTETSLTAADQMLDSSSMAAAGAISITRGVIGYYSGSLTGHQLVEQVLLDGTVRVGLAGSGAAIGSVVGMITLGPAGAWVFGAGAPVLAAMQTSSVTTWVRGVLKSKKLRTWERETHARLDELQTKLEFSLIKKIDLIEAKIAGVPPNEAGEYMTWRLEEDIRYVRESHLRLAAITEVSLPVPERRATALFREISICSIHASIYSSEMKAVMCLLKERPGLRDLIDQEYLEDAVANGKDTVDEVLQRLRGKRR